MESPKKPIPDNGTPPAPAKICHRKQNPPRHRGDDAGGQRAGRESASDARRARNREGGSLMPASRLGHQRHCPCKCLQVLATVEGRQRHTRCARLAHTLSTG